MDKGVKIVYVGMCADILHVGHINLLNLAMNYGAVIVGLLTDEAMMEYKGKPYMSYKDRFEIIKSLRQVSGIVPQKTLDYTDNLLSLKPDIVIHADDWKKGIQAETRKKVINVLKRWGGKLIEPPYTAGVSSTMLKKAIGYYDKKSKCK